MFLSPGAFAQWTYRVATDPFVRNITVFKDAPAIGTNTLIVSTLTDGMYKVAHTPNSPTPPVVTKLNSGLPTLQIRTHTAIDINTIYAGTDGAGLFKSTNGGTSWTALNGSGGTALGCMYVRTFNFDATTPRTLIVGTACRNNSGFYKSTDDGLTWSRLGNVTLPDNTYVSGLLRDTVTGTYYVATSNYGIYKSADSGASWVTANSGISAPNGTLNAFNVQFNGTAPNNLLTYVHGGGIYRSTDGGVTWTASNSGMPAGFAALGGINNETNLIKYIGLDKQGIYKTTDGGLNWLPWGATATHDRAKFARGIGTVTAGSSYYFATLDGLAYTTNNAVNVNGMDLGGGGRINAITHDRDIPFKAYVTAPTLYVLNYIYGDFNVSGTGGQLDTGVTGTTIDGAAYQDQLNPAILYVTTSNRGIFKSTNGGAPFNAINNGLPNMIGQSSRLSIDPNNSLILYLGLRDAAGVFKSTDGGANWVAKNTGLPAGDARSINVLAIDPNNSTIIYAATDAGLYKSTDSGDNWTLKYSATDSGLQLPVNAIRVRDGNSQELYIANYHASANGTILPSSGIQKSSDGGTTWANVLPNQLGSQVRVLVNGDVYAGISNNPGNPAVWLSTNGGTSFTPYSGGLNGSDIRTFGVKADRTAVISLSLENGMYTHNTAGPPPTVTLSAAITEAPSVMTTLYFDPQPVNTTSAAKSVTVTNTSTSVATIVGFGENSDQFGIPSHSCGTSLAPGASCIVNVVFTPQFSGDVGGAVLSAIGPVTGIAVPLAGIGTSAFAAGMYSMVPGMVPAYPGLSNTANIRELSWGNQAINTSRTLSFALNSIGSVPLNVTSITIDQPQFTLSGTCTGGAQSIPAGGSCTMSVTYTPTAAGNNTANLTVNSNTTLGVAGRINIALMGVGENPAIDGSLVTAFGDGGRNYISTGPYGNESAESIAKQSDGKTLVLSVGRNAVENGFTIPVITRLNLDGTLDTSWGVGGYVRLPTPGGGGASGTNQGRLFVLPSGKLIVSIDYNTPTNGNDAIVYRLLSTGVIDTSFGTAGTATVANFAANIRLYADGRILLGGLDPIAFPTNNNLSFVRLTADGALDPTFGTNGRSNITLPEAVEFGAGTNLFEITGDGRILFAYAFGAGAARDFAIYRLTTAGVLDTTWGTSGRLTVSPTNREDNIRQMRLQIDGKLLIAARTIQPTSATNYEISLIRLNSDGSLDTGFGTNGVVETIIGAAGTANVRAQDMLVLPDGKIVVAGHRNGTGFGTDLFLVRYQPNGALDTAFGTGGIKDFALSRQAEFARSIALDDDGGLLMAGSLTLTDSDRGNPIGTAVVLKVRNTLGPALVNLTVNKSGAGTVTSSPAGIDCGATCLASFATGSNVTLTATGTGGSTFTGWTGGGCLAGTAPCVVTMAAATTVTATFAGGAPALTGVVSRKSHPGNPTPFDVVINRSTPILGPVNVEPRAIGAGHTVVFQFDGPVAVPGTAAVVDAASNPAGSATAVASGNDVVVTLTGVADNKRVTVSLTGGSYTGTVSASMGFLVGDFNGTRSVNAADISAVKARIGALLTINGNPAFDVNVSGGISSPDVSAVKARSGLLIP